MTDTLFKEGHYSLGNLISDIGRGRIELHDNRRPLVWSNARRCARATRLAVAAGRDGSTLEK